ncbi:MAG: hypothetical protein JRI68_29585 [Deltaproteobacteria bacterium]|nr:hypothetical protein [Deltaproteobacteria bacterium]
MTRIRWTTLLLCVAMAMAVAPTVAWSQGMAPESADETQKAEARKYFMSAMEAWNDKRFEEALENFRSSYGIVASPNSHLMVVRTLVSLSRNAEAYVEAETVVAEADTAAATDPKYEATASAARELAGKLRAQIALVTVVGADQAAPPGATLTVAGRAVEPSRWGQPVAVDPGDVMVVLGDAPPKSVAAVAGGDHTVDFTPAPEPAPIEHKYEGPDRRMMAYIAGGVGAAGLLTFAIFGGVALAEYGDLDDQCPDKRCPTDLSDDASSGQTYQTVANVGLVIGLVGVAVGAGLFTWDLLDEDSGADAGDDGTDGEPMARGPRVTVGPGSAMLTVPF